MKKTVTICTILLLTALQTPKILFAAFGTGESRIGQPGIKEKKVKVLIRENGKLVEKDTTIVNGANGVVVIGKQMTILADSIYGGMGKDLKNKTVTVTVTDDQAVSGQPGTFFYTIGDTLQSDVTKKTIRLDDGKKMIILQNDGNAQYGSRHGYRTVSDAKVFQVTRDPFSFDANDSNVVSYKKKDLGKGLEKITIIRKKVK